MIFSYMKKLHFIYTLFIYVLVVMFAACTEKPKKFVIGVSQCSEDIWREKLNDELKMGEYLNDSIIVKLASSNDDNVLQNKQVNQFINEGVDLIVVSPNQLSAISKAVERAYDKGIPVILYDRKTNSDKYTAFIGCDNYMIGKSMGTFIAHQLKGKGRIVEISGLEGSSPAMERHRGFMDAIKPYPGIQVIASAGGDWKAQSAACTRQASAADRMEGQKKSKSAAEPSQSSAEVSTAIPAQPSDPATIPGMHRWAEKNFPAVKSLSQTELFTQKETLDTARSLISVKMKAAASTSPARFSWN